MILKRRKKRLDGPFQLMEEVKLGVTQGSVMGPFLLNVFINDVFFLLNETEICNYADDTTICCSH